MNVEEVEQQIIEIEKVLNDDERAHSMEDDLRHAVLESIANDPSNAQELAKEVLKTSDLDFPRWCA